MTDPLSKKEQIEAAKFMAELLGNSELLKAIEDGRTFRYHPQPDISTYELALALVLLLQPDDNPLGCQKAYDALPSEVQRHFAVIRELSDD